MPSALTADSPLPLFHRPHSVNRQLMAHACGSISTTIPTGYDTLGPSGLTHSLNEPNCAALFTKAELLTPSVKCSAGRWRRRGGGRL